MARWIRFVSALWTALKASIRSGGWLPESDQVSESGRAAQRERERERERERATEREREAECRRKVECAPCSAIGRTRWAPEIWRLIELAQVGRSNVTELNSKLAGESENRTRNRTRKGSENRIENSTKHQTENRPENTTENRTPDRVAPIESEALTRYPVNFRLHSFSEQLVRISHNRAQLH